jgi:hypothetical protein
MSQFGQTLFGGGGWMRWVLSPFVLLFAIFMPLALDDWTPIKVVIMAGMELMCLSLLAGFWLPARIGHWGFRLLAGLVFLAYAAYLVDELRLMDGTRSFSGRRSQASPLNAFLGLVIIGLPALWYAWRGYFGTSPEQLEAERKLAEAELLQPDWQFYEEHLQRPAPQALRDLYADQSLITAEDLAYPDAENLGGFFALRMDRLMDMREELGVAIVPIAWSESGELVFLRPGAEEADKVYLTNQENAKDIKVLAESVAVMLERLRSANADVLSARAF